MLPATPTHNTTFCSHTVSGSSIVTPPRPLPSQPLLKHSSEDANIYEETDTWEYDYPYMDKKLLSPPRMQNGGIKKSQSYDHSKTKQASQEGPTTMSQDSGSGDEYEQMISLKPPVASMTRSISHDGSIKQQNDDSYIKMYPEGQPHQSRSVVKSCSLDNTGLESLPHQRHSYINVPTNAERSSHCHLNETPPSIHRKLTFK